MSNDKIIENFEISCDYYYFYIFYKNQCIYSINLKKDEEEKTKINKSENEKLLLGSIYAINYLCFNIQPNKKLKNLYKTIENTNKNMNQSVRTYNQNIINRQENLHVGNFNSFNTPFYKLHYFETLTAYKFVLITHKDTPKLSNFLRDIYKTLFLDLIVFNPMYNIGDEIKDKVFDEKIIDLIKRISFT
ncbi:trafficking protein particle complex subunit 1, putative [Plasmodium gallinaceum]|uniref:Trafficking protein particle complex subunit n=1 Tax=Plasmodium gallinaceum TaxID=5849 RepID=A0A1J1GW91_PLAGA|nr:trafficking protein particle complex subunit 1, putative [Plasmodium gallinaceum]CRG95573.1 trafficking protein particle complex subunit 1, putative [Plasmodium gallinaceum]